MENTPNDFLEYVEKNFGSDAAIGVEFKIYRGNELIDIVGPDSPKIDDPKLDVISCMPDGKSAIICTNYAYHVANKVCEELGLSTQIVGFANEDNPEALAVIEDWLPGGHDFAIVAERYLVDPWVRLVCGSRKKIVYDLENEEDKAEAFSLYGTPEKWENIGEVTSPIKSLEQPEAVFS